MKKTKIFLGLVLSFSICLFLMPGCHRNAPVETSTALKDTLQETAPAIAPYVAPTLPALLTTRQDQVDYLALHFWDHFSLSDTNYFHAPEITEVVIRDYVLVFTELSENKRASVMDKFFSAIEKDRAVYDYYVELLSSFLYDPNSPQRNDELYMVMIRRQLSSAYTDEALASRLQFRLNTAMKNRIGTVATDFTYTTASGEKGSLHAFKSPYTVLYFYNPDCHNCKEVTSWLQASQVVDLLSSQGRLRILAIYVDEDMALWRSKLSEMPSSWVVGYDGTVLRNKQLYDLKAIPTLYLLDETKHVILKDVSFQQLEQWLAVTEYQQQQQQQ